MIITYDADTCEPKHDADEVRIGQCMHRLNHKLNHRSISKWNGGKGSSSGTTVYVAWKRAVIFVGWVFFLISLGGQAPHVLRAHM